MITSQISSSLTLATPYPTFGAAEAGANALAAQLPAEPTEAPVDRVEAAGEAAAYAMQAADAPQETGTMRRLLIGGMVALGLAGAMSAHPASAAGIYGVSTLDRPAVTQTVTPPSSTATPAVKKPVAPEVDPKVVLTDVRTYIIDMAEMNIVQGETLNTYQNAYINNVNTLQRIQRKIHANPSSLQDAAIRRIDQKITATLETVQEFSYETWDEVHQAGQTTITTPDGTRISRPLPPIETINHRVHADYSGPGRLTDQTVRDVLQLMGRPLPK